MTGNARPEGSSQPIGAILADFAARTTIDDLPSEVVDKVLLHTLDQIGAQVSGLRLDWNAIIRAYALSESPEGPSTLLGESQGVRPEWAGLANATAGHGFELDDYHLLSMTHPSCTVVPPVMAVGEELDSPGSTVIVALAIGLEVVIRLGLATQPSLLVDRGFHEVATLGVFGSSLAAGHLRGLDSSRLVSALGIAASHASGTAEYSQSGSEIKRLHAGLAAMAGIRAARLAALGFSGPRTAIEGKRGFIAAFTDDSSPDMAIADLGDRWHLLETSIKPTGTCGFNHAPIAAVQAILESENDIEVNDISEIVVGINQFAITHVGAIRQPKDMTSAQFSLPYTLAMYLVLGGSEREDYLRAAENDFRTPEILELVNRIRLEFDTECEAIYPRGMMAKVRVRLGDGREFARQAFAPGSLQSPLSPGEIHDKYLRIATPEIGVDRATRALEAVEDLRSGGTAAEIMTNLVLN